jgi:hypothetical protein
MRLLASLLLVALSGLPTDQAPGRLSFTATLDSIKISARPGQVVTRQFRLTLDPDQPRTHFKAHVEDWWRSEDGKQSFYAEAGTLKRSCANWVSVNPRESAISAEETMVVRLSVAVPVEVRRGGYWCALTVDEVPDPLADSTGIGVRFVASVSTGIFINLDPIERAASITDLEVSPTEARVRVRNEGNAPLGVEGRVEFLSPGATTPAASVVLPRGTILTEPISQGTMRAALPPASVLPSGHYVVRAVLDFGGDHYIGAEREIDIVRADAGNPSIR